ncbi:conserved hypothetical protein [Trichinella spiralis]|uniref:hypothetical protein n=1 Tax=Trichinella spiralis TaxID=6334 RepID=UPI0001EFE032|nr:conserved hypothetical protein [Trichinella spiralis]
MNDRERKIENRADEEDHAIHFKCLAGHILLTRNDQERKYCYYIQNCRSQQTLFKYMLYKHSIIILLHNKKIKCSTICAGRKMRRWYKCVQVNLTEAGKNEEQLRMKLEFYYCRIWKMYACSLG